MPSDAERIRRASGDEEALLVTADVLHRVKDDPAVLEALARGDKTPEKLALTAAIIVTHEIGRMYGPGTRVIADTAIKLSEVRYPEEE